MKEQFINKEIWMLTFGASFQRAYAYKSHASEKDKKDFRSATVQFVENLKPIYQNSNVTDEQHIKHIHDLSIKSKEFSNIFNGGQINFGIAQKILNLYLKYQWCLGTIEEPPHFPVDRIIQQKLNKEAKEHDIPLLKIEAWTQFKNETHYLKVINNAREIIKYDKSNGNTPAKLELELFQRR